MTYDPQFIAWLQAGPELWPALITARHDRLSADFGAYAYVCSAKLMAKCAHLQRQVNSEWIRLDCGLLARRGNHR